MDAPQRDMPCRYDYTHSQPQWADVLAHPSSPPPASGHPPVVRAPPLQPPHRCVPCGRLMSECACKECAVCRAAVGRGTRHHCRRCWRTVCGSCWTKTRYVHVRGRPMRVCDQCAVPWGLANLCKRTESSLYWGLYLLRCAGEMPSMCVAPRCHTLTYYRVCYVCGIATVVTQPHMERLVRVDTSRVREIDAIRVLDAEAQSARELAVDAMPPEEIGQTFRRCFPFHEEVLRLRGVQSAVEAQDILLSCVVAAISYEYRSGPNLTLQYSDVPYARLLKVLCAKPRYSIFEAPGKVKFIGFPGTHNWRTRFVDLNFSPEPKQVWAPLVEGVRVDAATGEAVPLCGGMRKVWEYDVHQGFAQEARETGLPVDELVADVRRGYRLVFSGHSLGGAVAQLVAMQVLAKCPTTPRDEPSSLAEGEDVETPRLPVLCVSLGSPLVGNHRLVERIEGGGWARCFHHFVYRTDVVPRLSCGDELTWEATSQVMSSITTAFQNVRHWFWRERDEAQSPPADADGLTAAADLPAGGNGACSSLEVLVDTAARRGREILEEGRESVVDAVHAAGPRLASATAGRDADAADAAARVREADDARLQLRQQRRFTCYGRYHFLSFGRDGYVSTADSETAFGMLKRGCGEPTSLPDHGVYAYNRGIMLLLNSKQT